MALLEAIASRGEVAGPVALVVAHPDDETLGLGSRLGAFGALTIIHLTDGSPRRLDDARRAGFADRAGYAAARRAELDAALHVLGAGAARRIAYEHPDQESIDSLDVIVDRLSADLDGVDAVITHPYEHGHPDHDTSALAVALACRRLALAGRSSPERLEFASYHLRHGRIALGAFWLDPACPERRIELEAEALETKRAAFACHVSQRGVFPDYPLSPERLREAPEYDFAEAAPPRDAVYDRFGWSITSASWRAIASRAWRSSARRDEESAPWRSVHASAPGC